MDHPGESFPGRRQKNSDGKSFRHQFAEKLRSVVIETEDSIDDMGFSIRIVEIGSAV